MKTLAAAWDWYVSTRTNLLRMQRLGTHHWNHPSLIAASIWNDEKFKEVEASDIEKETGAAVEPLDDLGILVLFSVFEAAVRDHLDDVIRPLTGSHLGHAILEAAAENVLEGIRQGSFANHILKPLKEQKRISPELTDKVNQVRQYRNWIAHGKRGSSVANLGVREVFDRLAEYLEVLGFAVEHERDEVERTEYRNPDDLLRIVGKD